MGYNSGFKGLKLLLRVSVNQIYGSANHEISDFHLRHRDLFIWTWKKNYFLSHFSFFSCSSRKLGNSCRFISLLFQLQQLTFETLMNGTDSQLCFQWSLFFFFKSFYKISFAWKNILIGFEFNSDSSENLGFVSKWKTHVTKECNVHLFSTL